MHHVTWDPVTAEKGGFKHFMLKEIFEQPRAIRDTMLRRIFQETGKVFLDEMEISEQDFRNFRNIKIVACGTSWHAGLAGKFMIERLAGVPVEVDYGSEFRYRNPIVGDGTLVVCIVSPAKPPTRSRPSAKPSKKARRRWPSATSSAPWSLAKPPARS